MWNPLHAKTPRLRSTQKYGVLSAANQVWTEQEYPSSEIHPAEQKYGRRKAFVLRIFWYRLWTWGNNVTCLTASISPCKVTLWLTKALETRTACCSLLLQKVKKALNKAFPLSPLTGRKEHSNNCWYDGSIGIAILEGKVSSWGCLNGLGFWRAVCVGWFCWGGGATVAMTVAVGGTGWIGCSGRMSAAARCFLDLFFFWTEVHRVRFSPVFCLFVLGLLELGVGVAGFGDVCASRLKMGSPSSSKRLEVFMSHAGYLRDGLTLVAKLASVSKSTLSGVWSSCWKWEKIVGLKLKSE